MMHAMYAMHICLELNGKIFVLMTMENLQVQPESLS